jgi:hypothetical protein
MPKRNHKPELTTTQWLKVKTIAKSVRSWAENYQRKYPSQYNVGLCGLCAKASARLHYLLTQENIPAKIGYTPGHVFVILARYFILDVTATQFNLYEVKPRNKPVEIRRRDSIDEVIHWYWVPAEIHPNAESLSNWQHAQKFWPDTQIAKRKEYTIGEIL